MGDSRDDPPPQSDSNGAPDFSEAFLHWLDTQASELVPSQKPAPCPATCVPSSLAVASLRQELLPQTGVWLEQAYEDWLRRLRQGQGRVRPDNGGGGVEDRSQERLSQANRVAVADDLAECDGFHRLMSRLLEERVLNYREVGWVDHVVKEEGLLRGFTEALLVLAFPGEVVPQYKWTPLVRRRDGEGE